MRSLFADTALAAIFRTVLAVFAILAGVAWIGTCACCRENIGRDLI
jgi:hypothetical protein